MKQRNNRSGRPKMKGGDITTYLSFSSSFNNWPRKTCFKVCLTRQRKSRNRKRKRRKRKKIKRKRLRRRLQLRTKARLMLR